LFKIPQEEKYIVKKRIFIICTLLLLTFNLSGCFGPGMNDYTYTIVKNYCLSRSSSNDIVIFKSGDVGTETVVHAKVTKVAWDDNFILAEQIPLIEETMELDKTKLNYWIIDVDTEELYGPLTKEELELKRSELQIDSSLELKDPEKFKYLRDKQENK